MKYLAALLPLLILLSCGKEKPHSHFVLTINVPVGDGNMQYVLSDTSLDVIDQPATNASRTSQSPLHYSIVDNDSLALVAQLNAKSYSCREQHALIATDANFVKDSSRFFVTPGINHPKELDIAVRIINSLVPDEYKLQFEDMQRAGDPEDKMNI